MENKIDTITEITDLGEGVRIILDFVDELSVDEGVLIGNTCKGFVQILSESRQTETYPPRTFRVNCGAFFQYIFLGEEKTKYLSEIRPGDILTVVSPSGKRMVAVGRVKKEKRFLQRIEMQSGISVTLQKADSVYVKGEKGPVESNLIKVGDKIVTYMGTEQGRHKGTVVEEYIEEL